MFIQSENLRKTPVKSVSCVIGVSVPRTVLAQYTRLTHQFEITTCCHHRLESVFTWWTWHRGSRRIRRARPSTGSDRAGTRWWSLCLSCTIWAKSLTLARYVTRNNSSMGFSAEKGISKDRPGERLNLRSGLDNQTNRKQTRSHASWQIIHCHCRV